MTSDEQVQRVWKSLEALGRRDVDGFMEFWSDDVVWEVGGDNPMGGVYRGKERVREAVRRFMESAVLRLEPLDVLADEGHVVIMFHTTGEREGKSVDMSSANFMTVDEQGKWKSCWWLPSDQKAYDEFWR